MAIDSRHDNPLGWNIRLFYSQLLRAARYPSIQARGEHKDVFEIFERAQDTTR